jgi:hypothetical protein
LLTSEERKTVEKTWKLSRRSMAELRKALLTNEDEAAAATEPATESDEARDEHGRRPRDDQCGVVIEKPLDPRAPEQEKSSGPRRNKQGRRKDKPYDPRRR